MNRFTFEKTNFTEVKIIKPFYIEDERGYFLKDFEKEIFKENGISFDMWENFESNSKKGVLRGLHFQDIVPQDKIIRVLYGEIFDVVADIRKDSNTLGQWQSFFLSAQDFKMVYVPKGFAHGFLTISDFALVSYKCSEKYESIHDSGIIWNDENIQVSWPIEMVNELIISDRDKNLQSLKEYLKKK